MPRELQENVAEELAWEQGLAQIHLVNYQHDIRPLDLKTRRFESCCWVIGDDARQALSNGGRVFFHETQASPSYFGGTIVGFRETPSEEGKPRRWAVEFLSEEQARNVLAGPSNWKRESKYVP